MERIETWGGAPVLLWTDPSSVEEQAKGQLKNISLLPWVHHHVAVMPDVHFGKGATVGSVIAMKGAIAPAAVGVDIGCGMGARRTDIRAEQLPDNLSALRAEIERLIPVGPLSHDQVVIHRHEVGVGIDTLFSWYEMLDPGVQDIRNRALLQLGTLGGGNHFIELCIDEDGFVWMVLHSGSRNIGNVLATIHMTKARKLIHNQELVDPDLAVFLAGTPEMKAYRHDLLWAQEYAMLNRIAMFEFYESALRKFFPDFKGTKRIMCHHNYVSEEVHFREEVLVTRKGAISARVGQYGIIPGSMGTRSYIVEGLGNPDSFCSASHGAGRRMSRGKAKKVFTVDDLRQQTAGVECRKDEGVLDEIPGAYKDIDQVMENQKDLVRIVHTLKQVLCVKG